MGRALALQVAGLNLILSIPFISRSHQKWFLSADRALAWQSGPQTKPNKQNQYYFYYNQSVGRNGIALFCFKVDFFFFYYLAINATLMQWLYIYINYILYLEIFIEGLEPLQKSSIQETKIPKVSFSTWVCMVWEVWSPQAVLQRPSDLPTVSQPARLVFYTGAWGCNAVWSLQCLEFIFPRIVSPL